MFSFFRIPKVKGIQTPFAVLAIFALLVPLGCGGGDGGGGEPQDPTVTSTVPADTATDVLLDTDISITFSEAMNKASVMGSLIISPPPASYASTWSGSTLTINPGSNMADSTIYTVTIGASVLDAEGASMGSPYSFDFTTGEISSATSTSPTDTATGVLVDADITITFSEPMNQSSVESNVSVSPDPGTVVYSWAGNTLTVNPDASLPEFTDHTVTVAAAAQDAEGTAMGSPDSCAFC